MRSEILYIIINLKKGKWKKYCMRISKLVRLAVRKAGNRVGLYSKKQSVEAATNIGKELVDLSKSGTSVTKEMYLKKLEDKRISIEH